MAASVIVLGMSAFLPVAGWKFNWVPVHWISGVVLTASVLFHLLRVTFVHGLREMMPGGADARELAHALAVRMGGRLAPAKYDAFQKGYHFAAASAVTVLVATGLLMLVKIDTSFWKRNPAIMSDGAWGVVYALHGVAALLLLFLVIVHVYFAFLPEHRALLISMVWGEGPEHARKETE